MWRGNLFCVAHDDAAATKVESHSRCQSLPTASSLRLWSTAKLGIRSGGHLLHNGQSRGALKPIRDKYP